VGHIFLAIVLGAVGTSSKWWTLSPLRHYRFSAVEFIRRARELGFTLDEVRIPSRIRTLGAAMTVANGLMVNLPNRLPAAAPARPT
jgi:hypothetical protein